MIANTGPLTSKLPRAGTTIFTVMSALAQEHGAINLSQGFPDFPVSSDLIDAVYRHMREGHNQYAPMAGLPALREALADKMRRLYGAAYDPATEITVTSGGTQALYTAMTSVVRTGDEVIYFEPAYDCYAPTVELSGGVPVPVPLHYPDYAVDWDEVRRAITPRTRMIVINTPHNPTGRAWTAADMTELERITDGTSIVVVSDEVYEHILFDGLRHESVCRYPGLASRSFVIYSFGKTYHATGWKMGYCLAPAALTSEFRKCHQFLVFCSHTPTQYALAEILQRRELYEALPAFYQQKRDYFLRLLEGSAFTWVPAQGSYFQLLNYSALSREKDTDYAVRLTRECGVAAIPVSAFYSRPPEEHVLRFCFAKGAATLEAAAEKLKRLTP